MPIVTAILSVGRSRTSTTSGSSGIGCRPTSASVRLTPSKVRYSVVLARELTHWTQAHTRKLRESNNFSNLVCVVIKWSEANELTVAKAPHFDLAHIVLVSCATAGTQHTKHG